MSAVGWVALAGGALSDTLGRLEVPAPTGQGWGQLMEGVWHVYRSQGLQSQDYQPGREGGNVLGSTATFFQFLGEHVC